MLRKMISLSCWTSNFKSKFYHSITMTTSCYRGNYNLELDADADMLLERATWNWSATFLYPKCYRRWQSDNFHFPELIDCCDKIVYRDVENQNSPPVKPVVCPNSLLIFCNLNAHVTAAHGSKSFQNLMITRYFEDIFNLEIHSHIHLMIIFCSI